MKSKTALIFDFDGVIADSLNALFAIYSNLIQKYGGQATQQEFNQLNGAKLSEIAQYAINEHKINITATDFESELISAISVLPQQLEPVEGAIDVLNSLNSLGFRCALATSSPKSYFIPFLNKYNLTPLFQHIISGDEIQLAKPHPEIYKKSMQSLEAEKYWVVEDSISGIAAAKDAGAFCIALKNKWASDKEQEKADLSIHSLYELIPKLLGLSTKDSQLLAFSQSISLQHLQRPYIGKIDKHVIDTIWTDAIQKNSLLFNDSIAIYHSHSWQNGQLIINLQQVNYSEFYASKVIGSPLPTIGVSAITFDQSMRFIYGKRNRQCTEYPEKFECMPSGGIPFKCKVWQKALLDEASEELGLNKNQIKDIQPLGLVFNRETGNFDIVASLHTTSFADICPNTEYSDIAQSQLQDQHNHKKTWVPLSLTLIDFFKGQIYDS